MTKAYKGRIVTKQKKAPYKNTPGVVIEYLEGPHSGKTVVQTAYKLYFFPENHTWAHLSANRSTRKNRKANRKTRKNTK